MMSKILKFSLFSAAMTLAAGGFASAEEQYCSGQGTPKAQEQVLQELAAQGYQKIKELEMEHGCYEAKGFDKDGQRVELYLEPATGAIVKAKKS